MNIIKYFLLINILFEFGCNNLNKNSHKIEIQDSIKLFDLKTSHKNYYSEIKKKLLHNEKVIDELKNLDSTTLFVIPVKKCFSCISESIEKIENFSRFDKNFKTIFISDSIKFILKELNGLKKFETKKILLSNQDINNINLMEVLKIKYFKNKDSEISIF